MYSNVYMEGETVLGDISIGVFRPLLPRAFWEPAIWSPNSWIFCDLVDAYPLQR